MVGNGDDRGQVGGGRPRVKTAWLADGPRVETRKQGGEDEGFDAEDDVATPNAAAAAAAADGGDATA